ncbi:PIN domain-containing protein [Pseudidiomarina mangrovi]|uniref:PIN domain-containing protein n=1 Tax=Pseudidiomarina mangrovi TaxID=2487133 RepID=UPI000FCAB7C7|nr:PIN domain-containing protein [Pseudidiomarina mangrovi]
MFVDLNTGLAQILIKDKPILFVDTCSILNLFNSIHQSELSESYVMAMNELILSHSKDLWLISYETIYEEWRDNIDNVEKTLKRELARLDRNISVAYNVSNKLHHTKHKLPHKASLLSLSDFLKQQSEIFFDTSIVLERRDVHSLRGMHRVRRNLAPAKRGKPEPKDCEIVECFLELAKELRAHAYESRILFLTANKDDFGKPQKLKPPLDHDFSNVNAELVTNIDHALAIVKELVS